LTRALLLCKLLDNVTVFHWLNTMQLHIEADLLKTFNALDEGTKVMRDA
jgi:hypothetical protein